MTPRRTPCSMRWGALACAFAIAGCTLQSGVDPTPATLNYPIALALSEPAAAGEPSAHLFVVNSNFDLRFNQATIQAFNLSVIDDYIADEGNGCVADDPCVIADLGAGQILSDEVAIGSHAEGIAQSSDGSRLYLPVRSDRNLTWIDWDGGGFACGQSGEPIPACDEAHRAGNEDGVASDRELTLDGDPVAVAAGSLRGIGGSGDGDFVLMALREGRVALFIDQPAGDTRVPELVHIAEGFAEQLVTMTLQPGTGVAWMTSAVSNDLGRVAIALDPGNPNRSFLSDFGPIELNGLDDGTDSRDVQFHPDRPSEQAFVLSRRPEAVLTLELDGQRSAELGDLYEVGAGPSRIAVATLFGRTYVFASSFNARRLFVIDVDYGALVATLGGFSGPFEMAIDPARNRLYIADFSTSVVRVIDLAPLAMHDPPEHVATLGEPTPPPSFVD